MDAYFLTIVKATESHKNKCLSISIFLIQLEKRGFTQTDNSGIKSNHVYWSSEQYRRPGLITVKA